MIVRHNQLKIGKRGTSYPPFLSTMQKSIIVQLDARKLEVKKLPLGKYAELLKAVRKLAKNISGLDKMNNDQLFEMVPTLISENLPDAIALIVIATDLTAEEAEAIGLDEAVDIVLAVVEVNKYKLIFEKVKKAMARPTEEVTPIASTNG